MRTAQRAVARSVNPEKTESLVRDRLPDAHTVANRARLAEECAALGKWQEAWEQYDETVRWPNGDESVFHLGKAEADLEPGRPAEALAGLNALKAREPDTESARVPCSMPGGWPQSAAPPRRSTLSRRSRDTIAATRRGPASRPCSAETGRADEGCRTVHEIPDRLRRAPTHRRKLQAMWGRVAEDILRRT
jgi:hypothetical protein